MGIVRERWRGEHAGHVIEVEYDNLVKTFTLFVDGREAGKESRILPRDITLTTTLAASDGNHTVTARSTSSFPFENATVTVDDQPLPLEKTK